MKTIIKILIIGFLSVFASCTSDFEEINTNPNRTNVGDIRASGMFEPIL